MVAEVNAASVAAAIGEPARARMLYCLLDGHARTSTELAIIGEISPSTASVHLGRLKDQKLVKVLSQGKHRYYSLHGEGVARVLEALAVVAGGDSSQTFTPSTPPHLRSARTCYDHMAGHVAVSLRDRFEKLNWLAIDRDESEYELTDEGTKAFATLGVNVTATRSRRRRFAYACVDWSERRPHIGGALGAALLQTALRHQWLTQNLDSRALTLTSLGRRQLHSRFGLKL